MTAAPRRRGRILAIGAVAAGLAAATAVAFAAIVDRADPAPPDRPPAAPAPAAPQAAEPPKAPSANPAAADAAASASARPPLGDRPDPGPVPEDHGIGAADLAAAIRSSVRISGLACGVLTDASGFAVAGDDHQAGPRHGSDRGGSKWGRSDRGGSEWGRSDLVATAAHPLIGMTEPEVTLADGRQLAGSLVAFDPVNDLAVLRVAGAGLEPLPLRADAPDGATGAVLAWNGRNGEREPASRPAPAPSPFLIDRPVTVRTEVAGGAERIERPSWLLAAHIATGHSGAALVLVSSGRSEAVGVVWGATRRPGGGVGYATRAGKLAELLTHSDLQAPADVPACR